MGAEQRDEGPTEAEQEVFDRILREEAPEYASVMRNLFEPTYVGRLRRLFEIVGDGGPYNCASSLLFSYLRSTYPSHYQELKGARLSAGARLHEGFAHDRSLKKHERSLRIDEDVVFCTPIDEPETYGFFLHEADVVLMALGSQLRDGRITVEEALEAWRPYRGWCPQVYDPPGSEEEGFYLMTGGGQFLPMPDAFELFVEGPEYTPATAQFELYAEDLDIPDVGWDWNFGNVIFSVTSEEGLKDLASEVEGEYKLVLHPRLEDYDFSGGQSRPQEAISAVEQALLG